MAEQHDFTVEAAFALFSASPIKKLGQIDVQTAMQNLGLSCTPRDAQLIVTRFDTDLDSKVGFWEFTNIFLPIDSAPRARLEARPSPNSKELSKETIRMVKKVLGSVVDAENMVEEIRKSVQRMTDSLRSLFD